MRSAYQAREVGGSRAKGLEHAPRRDRQPVDAHAVVRERVLDRVGDDGARRDDAALADALDPEFVGRRAWACGLRTRARWAVPGGAMSST